MSAFENCYVPSSGLLKSKGGHPKTGFQRPQKIVCERMESRKGRLSETPKRIFAYIFRWAQRRRGLEERGLCT
jgi:hypothetical protein